MKKILSLFLINSLLFSEPIDIGLLATIMMANHLEPKIEEVRDKRYNHRGFCLRVIN